MTKQKAAEVSWKKRKVLVLLLTAKLMQTIRKSFMLTAMPSPSPPPSPPPSPLNKEKTFSSDSVEVGLSELYSP